MAGHPGLRAAVAAVAALVAGACGGGGGSPAPQPPATTPVPGATQVTGRERLAWGQGDTGAPQSFRVYVDGVGATLESVSCVLDGTESACSAPLPAMSDGVHALDLAAVDTASGIEGARSETLTLQKIAARAARSVSALPDAGDDGVAGITAAQVTTIGAVDIVARGVRLPAQLAPLPDGRLLVAEQGGRVRLLDPDGRLPEVEALDLGGLVSPAPRGTVAIALPLDFPATRHVFLSDLYDTAAGDVRLRIVRLREVGARLGEPSRIFDAAVAIDAGSGVQTATLAARDDAGGPRLAFGPDGLLYALLPPGVVFDGQPAASRPLPAIVRLRADGSTPTQGPLAGIASHPLGFTWHPSTGALLGLVADGPSDVTMRVLGEPADGRASAAPWNLRFRAARAGTAPLLSFDAVDAREGFGLAHVAALFGDGPWPRTVRLGAAADVATLVPGFAGHVTDLVTQAGTVFAVVADAPSSSGGEPAPGAIVRVRP